MLAIHYLFIFFGTDRLDSNTVFTCIISPACIKYNIYRYFFFSFLFAGPRTRNKTRYNIVKTRPRTNAKPARRDAYKTPVIYLFQPMNRGPAGRKVETYHAIHRPFGGGVKKKKKTYKENNEKKKKNEKNPGAGPRSSINHILSEKSSSGLRYTKTV